MIERRAIVGLCLLCALAFTAAAAQSASALGRKGYTCQLVTPGAETTVGFKDPHCNMPAGNGTTGGKEVKYEHVQIKQRTKTSSSNAETGPGTEGAEPAFFHVTLSGIEAEIEAKTVTEESEGENKEEGGEAFLHSTGTLTFEGLTVKKPEGGLCSIEGGKVTTKELTTSTQGLAKGIKFQPAVGSTLAEFTIVNASGKTCPEAIKGKYTVSGSIIGEMEGPVISTTRAGSTEQGTLKTRNKVAGIAGKGTTKNSTTSTGIVTT